MSTETKTKSLGSAIDEIIESLRGMEKKDQVLAITAVCSHLALDLQPLSSSPTQQAGSVPIPPTLNPGSQQRNAEPKDIRSLKEQKNPSSAREMACIVAYYLQNTAPENDRKDSINAADITKYFKQAGFRLPSAIPQLLKDLKGAGYFDQSERGAYKLNPVGYNLVVHSLPKKSIGDSK